MSYKKQFQITFYVKCLEILFCNPEKKEKKILNLMWNRKNEKNEKMRFLTDKTIFFKGISFVKLREGKTDNKSKGDPLLKKWS